ncbi:MAG: hypothetical protein RL536_605 [Candidatus Parcubacteria bacterium]|jgi:hypothetical protein
MFESPEDGVRKKREFRRYVLAWIVQLAGLAIVVYDIVHHPFDEVPLGLFGKVGVFLILVSIPIATWRVRK